jgi:site-specific DNA recombinase
MTRRVVLYLRLSRSSDASTALARQNADLREYVTRQGWEVVRVLEDDGKSGRQRRANADEALRMLSSSEADVLAVAAVDRWTREGLEAIGRLVGVLRESGAEFFSLRENLSSRDENFELTIGIHGSIAKREGELIASRVASSRRRLDSVGRFKGGVVPFGFRPVRREDGGVYLEHDPEEVPHVRYIVDAVLAGDSLTKITRELRARNVPTTKSAYRTARQRGEAYDGLDRGTWHIQIVRKLATSPTLAGWTTRPGPSNSWDDRVVVRDSDGAPRLVAPPIIDGATLERLTAALPPGRKRRVRQARWLSGVVFCATCENKAYVVSSGKTVYYRCSASARDMDSPCKSPRILAEPLEAYIEERFLAVAGKAPEHELVVDSDADFHAAQLADVEAALADATTALVEDDGDGAEIVARIQALKARRMELRTARPRVTRSFAPTGRTLAAAWAAGDVDRRQLLLQALDHVRFSPVTVPNTPEKRVTFYWRS